MVDTWRRARAREGPQPSRHPEKTREAISVGASVHRYSTVQRQRPSVSRFSGGRTTRLESGPLGDPRGELPRMTRTTGVMHPPPPSLRGQSSPKINGLGFLRGRRALSRDIPYDNLNTDVGVRLTDGNVTLEFSKLVSIGVRRFF